MDSASRLMQKIKIKSAKINRLSRQLTVELNSNDYLKLNEEKELSEYFKTHFETDNLKVQCVVNSKVSIEDDIKEDIIDRMIEHCPTLTPYKDKILIDITNDSIALRFPDVCGQLLNATDTIRYISEYMTHCLGISSTVSCKMIENGNGKDEYKKIKEKLSNKLAKESKDIIIPNKKPRPEPKKVNKYARKRTAEVVKISDLKEGYDRVVFECEVIDTETKILKSGKRLVLFDVTDYTSSVTCKMFTTEEEALEYKSIIKAGATLEVEGRYEYDTFAREYSVRVRKIDECEPIKSTRSDTAKNKRVELHLHTKMSSKDGFIEPGKLFRNLADWGHKAVAVTDHGVVQAFPDVYEQSEKYGIKALYGVEGYLIDDGRAVMYNPDDSPVVQKTLIAISNGEEITVTDINDISNIRIFEFDKFKPEDALVLYVSDKNDSGALRLGELGHKVIDLKHMSDRLTNGKWIHPEEAFEVSITYTAGLWRTILKAAAKHDIKKLNELCIAAADVTVDKKMKQYHVIIFAKNKTGLKNLYELISYSHINFFYKKPRIPKSILEAKRLNVYIGSACEAGEVYRAVVAGLDDNVLEKIAAFYDYLEIQPVGNNNFMVRDGIVKSEDDIKTFNKKVDDLGLRMDIPVAATCDAHFFSEEDALFRKIIMHGMKFKDVEFQAPLFLRTTDEMLEEFSYLGKERAYKAVVEVPAAIADSIDKLIPIPKGTYPPSIEGSDEELRKICKDRLAEIYGDSPHKKIIARINKELDSIINNGFSVMYIISQKLAFKSLEDGYLVGSRGSVGSSFAAFLTKISEVNPLEAHYICHNCHNIEFADSSVYDCGIDMPDKKCPICGSDYGKDGFDIPFETFLGFDGDKMPDIDQNFSGEYQATAHKYVEELFGSDHVFKAGTISTFADKTSKGFVRGYLEENGMQFNNAELKRLVKGLDGVKRTTGQHPGGMVVLPQGYSIHDFTPVQRPANDQTSDTITTHFDFNSMHDTLLKLDILGHDDPTVLKMLEDQTGIKASEVDIKDEKIMSLFNSVEALNPVEDIGCDLGVLGIPEFGTHFVRGMLRTAVPTSVSDLIKLSGLSHGTNVWNNNAEELIRAGTATLQEVISIRDNIMLYLIHHGIDSKMAFEITEKVRKKFGKLTPKHEKIMLDYDVPQWYVDSCKKIEYMFPKAHAAAYVIMALRIAWYKIYYPKEYYTAYFTIRADEFEVNTMGGSINDCRRNMENLKNGVKKMSAREQNIYTILEIVVEMLARGIKFKPVD
ncbi:MAG: PolC-type DNA polymerase III, partial [Clostridiales bacterium]|nr:PolC-type DNA polymerase III [Clostridiales bacterium]